MSLLDINNLDLNPVPIDVNSKGPSFITVIPEGSAPMYDYLHIEDVILATVACACINVTLSKATKWLDGH